MAFEGASGNTYDGTSGADTLNGGAGNDLLRGFNGTDTLDGNTGNDYLQGGGDSDTYVYNLTDGQDVINDAGGAADVIALGAGITSGHLTMTRVGNHDLVIDIDTGALTGQIMIEDQFRSGENVETITFSGARDARASARHSYQCVRMHALIKDSRRRHERSVSAANDNHGVIASAMAV